MRNRFKRLDLIDRVTEKLWTDVCYIIQEAVIKTIPKKEMQKGRTVVLGGLLFPQVLAEKRREAKGKGEKECGVPKNGKERYESLPK